MQDDGDTRIPISGAAHDGERGPHRGTSVSDDHAEPDTDEMGRNLDAVAAYAAHLEPEDLPTYITALDERNLHTQARERRQMIVLQVAERAGPGMKTRKVCEEAGISYRTLNRWCTEDQAFDELWIEVRHLRGRDLFREGVEMMRDAGDGRGIIQAAGIEDPQHYSPRVVDAMAVNKMLSESQAGVEGEHLALHRRVVASVPKEPDEEIENAV